mgnify:CR=1 FL=1
MKVIFDVEACLPLRISTVRNCLCDWSRPLRLEVFDWDLDGGHDFIGACVTNLETLVQGEDFQIVQVKIYCQVRISLIFRHFQLSLILSIQRRKARKGMKTRDKLLLSLLKLSRFKTSLNCIFP